MAKRNKKQQQQSNRYSATDCEIRPVTKSDKWCQRRVPRPYLPKQNTWLDGINGRIVRSKKHCGKLLLQVIMKSEDNPQYGVGSFARHEPNVSVYKRRRNKKKLYRILNIRNLDKGDNNNKW